MAAGIASNLVNRIDPRYLAGIGTLMAAVGLFGFSRLPFDTDVPVTQNVQASYVTDLLPGIILMSVGMGLTFVPLTLTAVHHLRAEDSGIGSGVLNTMQQVGGALGLATLSTVASHVFSSTGDRISAATAAGPAPDPSTVDAVQRIVSLQIFTNGAADAFLVGSVMALASSLVIWFFLDVKHDELATDGPEVHAGGLTRTPPDRARGRDSSHR